MYYCTTILPYLQQTVGNMEINPIPLPGPVAPTVDFPQDATWPGGETPRHWSHFVAVLPQTHRGPLAPGRGPPPKDPEQESCKLQLS